MAPMKLQGLVNYVLGNFVLLSGVNGDRERERDRDKGLSSPIATTLPGDLLPSQSFSFSSSTATLTTSQAGSSSSSSATGYASVASASAIAAGLALTRPRTPPPKNASATAAKPPLGQRLNEFRALPYFVRAAKAGDPRAKAVLGFYWEHGLAHLPVSYARAEPLYTQAAAAGAALAQARLAFLKMYGRPGIPINQADARTWRKKLSRRGRRALHWLKLAADAGLPAAQFCLASCFYNAIGTRKDDRRAFVFAGRAAGQGHPGAQNLLGMLYVDGISPDVVPDPTTGMRWYIRASEQGEAAAIYNIATLFERGVAIDESPAQAFRWYLRAAEYGSISAANIVGLFYEQGVIGEGPDATKAAEWYARAATQGHPFAQYNVGRCHVEGLGVPTDPSKALGYFERAAQQRHVLARMSLACMWENGIGVERPDKRRALEWFRRAAYRGSREAQRRLKPVWASRILVACRALLATGTLPAPNIDPETTGLWSLPLELKEQIVFWLNSEVILNKSEMRNVVRYGRSRDTLWGEEAVVSRPLQLTSLSIASGVDGESPEGVAEAYMGKMLKKRTTREGDAEGSGAGPSTTPDSPGSVRGESSSRLVPGFGPSMSARRSGANTPLRPSCSDEAIADLTISTVRLEPTFSSFLNRLGIRNYGERRICTCPEGTCRSLRHAMNRYHDREESDSDMELDEAPEGAFETPDDELFAGGDDDLPNGQQQQQQQGGFMMTAPLGNLDHVHDVDGGNFQPGGEFADLLMEEDDDVMYTEVAGIVTGEDGDFDDGRSDNGA